MKLLDILPDLLRSSTSVVCILLLLPILSKNKLKIRTTILIITVSVFIVLAVTIRFYLVKDYKGIVYFSLLFYLIIMIGFKYLYKEKLFQWLFNCITVLNIYAMIVITSFFLSYLFEHPQYGVTLVRLILFMVTIIFFKKLLRPLYLDVSENWVAFLLPTSGILVSYLYILLSLEDVKSSMHQNLEYFYFITLITVLSYIAIMFSLKNLKGKFLLREENIKKDATEQLLRSEIVSYESIVLSAKQTNHDIRHHNSILLEYLMCGDIDGATDYLKLYDDNLKESSIKFFSKNPIANAVFRIYERRSRENNIKFVVHSEADFMMKNRIPEIGVILSNILENALTACKECSFNNKYIYYSSIIKNDSILIEIKNSVSVDLKFENGLPISTKHSGGTGLKSVKHMINKYNGMLVFRLEKNEFFTQIILPLT